MEFQEFEKWHVEVTPEGKVFVKPIPGQIVAEIDPGPDQMKHAALIAEAPALRAENERLKKEKAELVGLLSRILNPNNGAIGSLAIHIEHEIRAAISEAREGGI